jgi:hypothetical protein
VIPLLIQNRSRGSGSEFVEQGFDDFETQLVVQEHSRHTDLVGSHALMCYSRGGKSQSIVDGGQRPPVVLQYEIERD